MKNPKHFPDGNILLPGCASPARRRVLGQLATASGLAMLGFPEWASAALNIHSMPRVALVIGNSKYNFSPLANPANDANAIAARLKELGFDVIVQTEAQRVPMENAINAYCDKLSNNKAVGVFYYAGHGLQVNWRNYLVPIGANLNRVGDIPQQALDLNLLLQGLNKANNPMNVVILDACRDNPFGGEAKTGKGLSQMDAPLGTLLAYATAPGNVAQDGMGQNGLYTESLLRELSVPEAKIEDIFKRVRLSVRRASQGQQIPWESTSLEEDFYFLPPANIRKLSEKEKEQLYLEEKAIWENAQTTNTPAALENYLRRYPSGYFSELALVQLNRQLAKLGENAVKTVSSVANPYSKGSAEANTSHQIGDSYTYQVSDRLSKAVTKTYTQTITQITDTEVIYNEGEYITDLIGNWHKDWAGRKETFPQHLPLEYTSGKQWVTRYSYTNSGGRDGIWEWEYKVTKKEPIEIPVGTFEAFRVEGQGKSTLGYIGKRTMWLMPERWRVPLVIEDEARLGSWTPVNDRLVLINSKLATSSR